MAGRGMHKAGTGVVGDVIADEKRHREPISATKSFQRVRTLHCVHRIGGNIAQLFITRDTRLLEDAFREHIRQDQKIAILGPVVGWCVGDLVEAVGDLRRERDGAVAWQRPWRGGPNDDGRRCKRTVRRRRHRKLHPYRIARVVLVLDFGFSERGLFHHAPHHRLGAAIESAVGGELHQFARDLGFGEIIHRGVGMIPVADDAEPLEFLTLHVEPACRVGAALLAERHHRGGVAKIRLRLAFGAVILFLDLPFDRQAVTVPAGHVVGIKAEHLLALGNDVLEDLVQRVPDMDVAVGVGRAVVQHEFRPAGG